MNTESFTAFESDAHAAGFDEVIVREWAPAMVVGRHAHPFDVEAVVTRGEMWLTCEAETRHVKAGDVFVVDRGVMHDERYGVDGATIWVARRNPRA